MGETSILFITRKIDESKKENWRAAALSEYSSTGLWPVLPLALFHHASLYILNSIIKRRCRQGTPLAKTSSQMSFLLNLIFTAMIYICTVL